MAEIDKKTRALFRAIEKKDYKKVRKLLELGASLTAVDENGNTALHLAAIHANSKITRALLREGASLNATNNSGKTPLALAYAHGKSKIVETLGRPLEKGGERPVIEGINDTDKYGDPLLHCAIESGDTKMALALIKAGANLEAKNDAGETPLFYAIKFKNAEVRAALYEAGAQIRAENRVGNQPLHMAAMEGNGRARDELLRRGVDVSTRNKHGQTPIHLAARSGNAKMVRRLAKRGASIYGVDKSKRGLLHFAAESGDLNTLKTVTTSLQSYARDRGFHQELDFNQQDRYGQTLLHYAVFSKNPKAVDFLIKQGARKDICDKWGNTPLHLAFYQGNSAVAKRLLRGRPKILTMKNNKGLTPLDVLDEALSKGYARGEDRVKMASLRKLMVRKGAKTSAELEAEEIAKKKKPNTTHTLAAFGQNVTPETQTPVRTNVDERSA